MCTSISAVISHHMAPFFCAMSLDGEKNLPQQETTRAGAGGPGGGGGADLGSVTQQSSVVTQPVLLPDRSFHPGRLVASSPGALRSGTPAGCWTTSWPLSCTAQAVWPMSRVRVACPTSSTISSLEPQMASTRAWPLVGTGDLF